MIADTLANFYQTYFEQPSFDSNNLTHVDTLKIYTNVSQLPDFSLENIILQEASQKRRLQCIYKYLLITP
jgi:hypothetical protein